MSSRERRAKARRQQRRAVRAAAPVVVTGMIAASGMAASAAPAQALTFSSVAQVANLNLVASGSDPQDFTSVGSDVYFVAYQYGEGRELWETDGSSAHLVDDIVPGNGGSYPTDLTNVDGQLFFVATGSNGSEALYTTNGTASGTVELKPDVYASDMTADGNELYFDYANELWRSDGTPAGTVEVAPIGTGGYSYYGSDITPVGNTIYFIANGQLWSSNGSSSAAPVSLNDSGQRVTGLENVDGLLYFAADGSAGSQIWTYDGTTATDVDTIDAASGAPQIGYLTSFDGDLFFAANDGTDGVELWKSNGSEAGTVALPGVTPGNGSSYYHSDGYGADFTVMGSKLYFFGDNDSGSGGLWETNGTNVESVDATLDTAGYYGNYLTGLTASGSELFFELDGQLYSSNGSSASQVPGEATYGSGSIASLGDGQVAFSAQDLAQGSEPWVSDDSSMSLISDINAAGNSGSYPHSMVNVNGTLYFAADSGTTAGTQLWQSNGSAAGTTTIDIPGGPYAYPNDLTNFNGTLFFMSEGQLYKLGPDGPTQIADPSGGSYVEGNLTVAGNELYVRGYASGAGEQLWETNGSSALTQVTGGGTDPYELTNVGGTLYFGSSGQLYAATGSTAQAVSNPSDVEDLTNLTAVGDELYFIGSGNAGSDSAALWTVSGGAVTAVTGYPTEDQGYATYVDTLANFNGTLYFTVDGYLYDASGTTAAQVNDPADASGVSGPAVVGDELYFSAYASGSEGLWETNGSSISFVSSIADGGSYVENLTNFNGTLMFTTSGSTGPELWQSDGTAAGTQLVASIDPGAYGSDISYLTPVGNTLFFQANDGTDGPELWQATVAATGGAPAAAPPAAAAPAPAAPVPAAVTPPAAPSLKWDFAKTRGGKTTLTFTLGGTGSFRVGLTLSVVETVEGKKILGVAAADRGPAVKKVKKPKKVKKTVVLGRKAVTATGGKKATVVLTLDGAGERLLKEHKRLRVHLGATVSGHTLASRTLTFTEPKPKKKKKK